MPEERKSRIFIVNGMLIKIIKQGFGVLFSGEISNLFNTKFIY